MTEPAHFERPSAPAIWLSAARPRTLPAAVAPVLAASALAWHDGVFQALPAAVCVVFALLIQIGTNFANDYYDYIKGADTAERVGPKRAVAAGWVKPRQMMAAMVVIFSCAFGCGLMLLPFGGWPLLVIGIASILSGIAYTGGPFPLGYNGLGDVFVFVFFGLVAVCATYFVQAGQVPPGAYVIAAGIGFLTTNILVVNNYRDVETDAKAGKRTLVVRFGRGFARSQYIGSIAAALLVPVVLVALGFKPWVLLAWGIAPLAARHVRRLKASTAPRDLIVLLGDTGKLLAFYAILLSAGLVLARP